MPAPIETAFDEFDKMAYFAIEDYPEVNEKINLYSSSFSDWLDKNSVMLIVLLSFAGLIGLLSGLVYATSSSASRALEGGES